ncbi:MAG: pitrilysin family protein, partial [bacterium]|nr:pitrilysin family protein [bacterium]
MSDYKLTILSNGLRVASAQMPGGKSTTVIVGIGAGSRYETRRTSGLSHFLEHMAFKGTKRRQASLIISSEVLGLGGKFNAFTDKEFTGYWIKIANSHLEMAFDILSDILSGSLFVPEEIEKEKGVIIEEINMRQDTPMVDVAESFSELIYGDNPMGWDIAGKKETVTGTKRNDFTE